jgi:hypothetical protein
VSTERDAAYAVVDELAEWSDWRPFFEVAEGAPTSPGVYQMRLRDGLIVYVGMAGERRGQGIRGRLSIYRRGKGAVSGFGEAALNRALADAEFIEEHLANVREGQPSRASVWAIDAIRRLDVEVRWTPCETAASALAVETAVVALLRTHGIWNRVANRAIRTPASARAVVEQPVENGGGGPTTVAALSAELGRDDGGRAVRRTLRQGCPDHVRHASWDPLTSAHVAYVRSRLGRSRP